MTRKCSILFFILFFCSFFLLSGLLGEHGLVYKKQLEAKLKADGITLEKLEMEEQNLLNQRNNIYSIDFLKDHAFQLGYTLENEEVFFFTQDTLAFEEKKLYHDGTISSISKSPWYLSRFAISIVSFIFSAASVLIYVLFHRTNSRKRVDKRNGIE